MISSGEGGPTKALEYALRASRALERKGESAELELAMSLHVTAAIYCALSRHAEAIPVLERAVSVAKETGEKYKEKEEEASLAEFAGWMQLGDTHAMLGRTEESVSCYEKGLEVQIRALGENDSRVAETCRLAIVDL
jgi:tetratricopeptide (TPR) repeat protein